jgi:hypothetical protein
MSSKTKAIIVPEDVEYNPESKSLVVTKPAPLELSYAQAKKLMKQLRPPPSDKKREQGKRLGQLSKERWRKIKEEDSRKETEAQAIVQRQQVLAEKEGIQYKKVESIIPKELVTIKPKKQYKPREKKIEPKYNDVDDNESEYEEIIEYVKPKKKKVIKKIVEDDSDDDPDEGIQKKVKKATKTIETINKLDSAISQLKTNTNPYASAFARIKF